MRTDILHIVGAEGFLCVDTLLPLSLILCHPGTALLSLTRMEVGIEDSEIRAVFVEHLIGLHIRMVYWYILVLLEGDAIKTVGQSEHSVDNLREFEIGPEHLSIEIIFLKLQLMRIKPEVPWLHLKVLTLRLPGKFLYCFHLLDGCRFIGSNKVIEQFIYTPHVTCHTMLKHIVCVSLMPQQLCQFTTQVDKTFAYLKVILRIIVDTLRILRHIHLLTQLSLGRIGHKW